MRDDALTTTIGGSSLNPDAAPWGTIPGAGHIFDTISQITEPSDIPLAAWESLLSVSEMGHPTTPDSRPLIFMDEKKTTKDMIEMVR